MYRIKRFFKLLKYILNKKYSVNFEKRSYGFMVFIYKDKNLYDKLYLKIKNI